MSVRIGAMGALCVFRQATDVTPSQPKLRQLTALLAVRAGTVVRLETISRELWDRDPCEKTTRTLQTYVSQLRRIVSGGEATIEHTPKVGYRLRLARPECVDVSRFRELAAVADRQLRADRPDQAGKILLDALELCRGPVLSDVHLGPVLSAQAAALDRERVAVLARYLDLQLRLGRPAAVLKEADRICAEDPRHDGLYASLMVAFGALGRSAEAADLYDRLRVRQAVEPGPAVRAAFPDVGGVSVATPAQLPLAPARLVGFERPAGEVRTLLTMSPRPGVVCVIGSPGSGNSTFCAHVADRLRGEFPGGQLYADLATTSADAALESFLSALGKSAQAGRAERVRTFRQATTDRNLLVLLDNAADPDAVSLLRPGSGSTALVAGHARQCADGASAVVELPRLTSADMVRLLGWWIGTHRLAAEPAAATRLAAGCHGLPVALRLVASLAARRPHWTLARLADRLSSAALPVATVRRSLLLLTPLEKAALHRIVADGGDVLSVRWTSRLLGTTANGAEALLEKLVEIRLADPVDATGDYDSYRLDPLYRQTVRALDDQSAASRFVAPLVSAVSEPA
ncbi:AfsR/SARP family transcriptional regulator [Fodinicola acaciae]|uniref:AfsR/SARP family transcriptional regulator n=1 Tax=Fodinicola acaciae TaxID=2681555 RepID=UPI0013CF7E74|nr:AfsR/SARP family transcriptional regulator [Fodinicola acaciae]